MNLYTVARASVGMALGKMSKAEVDALMAWVLATEIRAYPWPEELSEYRGMMLDHNGTMHYDVRRAIYALVAGLS